MPKILENTSGSTKRKIGSNISSCYATTSQKMIWRSLRVWRPFLVKLMRIAGILKGWRNICKMTCAQIQQLLHFISIRVFFQSLPYLTHSFPIHPFSTSENIRKPYGLIYGLIENSGKGKIRLAFPVSSNISPINRSSHRRCSVKKVFLKISQISQKNSCVGVSL